MAVRRVLGVLAGGDLTLDALRKWVRSAEIVLAADGGANRLKEIGVVPFLTVGDLDSIDAAARDDQDKIVHDPNQDTSDVDKLLALAHRLGHSRITLACVEGDLLDHVLGTVASAARAKIQVRLALRRGFAWILRSGESCTASCPVGTRVSLIPITPSKNVSLHGVHWPLDDAELRTDGLVSLSNRADAPFVKASVGEGAALLFVGYAPGAMPLWEND